MVAAVVWEEEVGSCVRVRVCKARGEVGRQWEGKAAGKAAGKAEGHMRGPQHGGHGCVSVNDLSPIPGPVLTSELPWVYMR